MAQAVRERYDRLAKLTADSASEAVMSGRAWHTAQKASSVCVKWSLLDGARLCETTLPDGAAANGGC